MQQVQMEFFSSINCNDLFWLQELLHDHPDMDVDQPLIGSMTGLHVAAEKGYSSCLQILIAAGKSLIPLSISFPFLFLLFYFDKEVILVWNVAVY